MRDTSLLDENNQFCLFVFHCHNIKHLYKYEKHIKLTHTYCNSGRKQIAGHSKRNDATLEKFERKRMQQMSTKLQQQIIEWRTAKVMELLSKGESNQYEIARYCRLTSQLSVGT
jgi:hypothetical protein